MKTDGKGGFLLKQINDSLAKKANNELKESDLTMMQVSALLTLKKRDNGEMTLKAMEKFFSLSQPTVAGLIMRMDEKGIVDSFTDKSDRRVKIVRLTQKGEECLSRASVPMENAESTLVSGLSDDEVSTLHMKENLK